MASTSTSFRPSQSVTRSIRARMELTFPVAILMAAQHCMLTGSRIRGRCNFMLSPCAHGRMGNSSRRHALRRTYLSLGLGELAAVAVFLYASMSVLLPGIRLHGGERALWLALIPLVVILTQAGAYWLLARGWVPGGRM